MFNELNILKLFFDEPSREFNVREAARLLKIAPATASSRLKEFSKEGILQERVERNLILFKANIEDDKYKDLKVYYSIRKLRDSGLMAALNEFYLKPTIVLFGSMSFGMDAETSDYDLLVISENTKEFKDIKKFEAKLKRRIQLHIFSDISEIPNEHLISNILNGIRLQGKVSWTSMNASGKVSSGKQKSIKS